MVAKEEYGKFSRWSRVVGFGLALGGLLLAPAAPCTAGNPPYPGTQPTKEADRSSVAPGGTITWTITFYNDGADDPATIFLTDDVPDPADGLPVLPWTIAADLISRPPGSNPSYNNDTLNITNITVPAGGTRSVVLRTQVSPTAADGAQICNRAWLRYTVDLCVGSPFPQCDTFSFDSGTRPPGGVDPAPTCVTVRAAGSPDVHAAQASSTFADSCPSDPGFPAPNQTISPGETLSLVLAIQNAGPVDAAAQPAPITGTVLPGSGYTVITATSPYTTTPANVLQSNNRNTGTNSTPFVIRIDPDIPCPSTLTVRVQVSSIASGPYIATFTFPVGGATGAGCSPRCLDVALTPGTPATVRDVCAFTPPGSNGRIDPGDDVFLRLPVTNNGPDDLLGAPTILGTLTAVTPGVTVIPGNGTSNYNNLAAGATVSSTSEFGITLPDSLACGSHVDLLLTLTNTDGGTRTIPYPLTVASPCTPCSMSAPCAANSETAPGGPVRYCLGGTVQLDGSSSTLTGCNGVPEYQWNQNGVPIAGATAVTYDIPTSLPAGAYVYTLDLTCSTNASCTSRSAPINVQVDPEPLVVLLLKGTKATPDVELQWTRENTASGGYRIYRTVDKTLIPMERAGTAGVTLAGSTAPDPMATSLTIAGDVTASDPLYHYQALTVCSDNRTEGPN